MNKKNIILINYYERSYILWNYIFVNLIFTIYDEFEHNLLILGKCLQEAKSRLNTELETGSK